MKVDPYFLSACMKLKYKWIKDLNIKLDTLNLIETKMGNSLECIDTENESPEQNTNGSDTKMDN